MAKPYVVLDVNDGSRSRKHPHWEITGPNTFTECIKKACDEYMKTLKLEIEAIQKPWTQKEFKKFYPGVEPHPDLFKKSQVKVTNGNVFPNRNWVKSEPTGTTINFNNRAGCVCRLYVTIEYQDYEVQDNKMVPVYTKDTHVLTIGFRYGEPLDDKYYDQMLSIMRTGSKTASIATTYHLNNRYF